MEEIDFEVCLYGDSGNALLQQHDTQRYILTEPAAWSRSKLGSIPNWGHSELGAFWNWGRNRAVKTNWLVNYIYHKNDYSSIIQI